MSNEQLLDASENSLDDRFGIQPANHDGFETGDFRNFSPVYLGTDTEWIRPSMTVTENKPIDGDYSLHCSAGDGHHRWLLVSNAFSLQSPFVASAKFRLSSLPEEVTVGLGVFETGEESLVITGTRDSVELYTEGLDADSTKTLQAELVDDEVYEFELALTEGEAVGKLRRDETGELLALFNTDTTIAPTALGLYVDFPPGADTEAVFDCVSVDTDTYRVPSNQWVRSPRFVTLPRQPDLDQDQGNWVGAHSIIDERERSLLWYRIRNNNGRGAGYGLAASSDGLNWERVTNTPVLTKSDEFVSNEGITVLSIDGTYRAWYAVDDGETWHVVYATSEDGIHWENHGVVVEGYCKDPIVLYKEGTYYMYAIAPTTHSFSVYTSADGLDWERQNTMELASHRHPGAYYVEETEQFWLYAFAEEGLDEGDRFAQEELTNDSPSRVSIASSTDGIHFDEFSTTWRDPALGLDDRPAGGIDYGRFPTDAHGHLAHDDRVLMYYQARHNYDNNRPGWQMAGDGRIVLAGRFRGFYDGITTTVSPSGTKAYHSFPHPATPLSKVKLETDTEAIITLQQSSEPETLLSGNLLLTETGEITLVITDRVREASYELSVNGDRAAESNADEAGTVRLTTRVDTTEKVDVSVQRLDKN
ncbi:hypothetical protein [Haloarcula marina]|uniref:hypothetical protein n=1 Tax=Haloarcula marina TaxID=2961574 RepID=UPI0020B74B93|nr:hypothetical protein [Halomicroarcula marina]